MFKVQHSDLTGAFIKYSVAHRVIIVVVIRQEIFPVTHSAKYLRQFLTLIQGDFYIADVKRTICSNPNKYHTFCRAVIGNGNGISEYGGGVSGEAQIFGMCRLEFPVV